MDQDDTAQLLGGNEDIAEAIEDTPIDTALDFLRTTREGLTDAQVKERLDQYGPNDLPEVVVHPIIQFLYFLWNPLSWTMELAAIMSLVLSDYVDAGLIAGLLLCNAAIGYWEEHSSDEALQALKGQLAPTCLCKRNGAWAETDAHSLVPGDIIKLHIGCVVPADVKLLEGDPVKIDQSSLTGESLPVNKGPGKECYSGSSVKQGEIEAVVYATGPNTFFGKAANLVQSTESHGHFQVVLKRLGYFCITFIIFFVALELLISFLVWGRECTGVMEGQCLPLTNALVLIVGGIPIAMPTVLSVTMAIGAGNLAKEKAIVTRLTAVEELAGMDVLCSDKTGTLTLNKLTVADPIHIDGDVSMVPLYAGLSSQREVPEPIDNAINGWCPCLNELDNYNVLHFTPFNPNDKRTEAKVQDPKTGEIFYCSKGAPQIILGLAHNTEEIRDKHENLILDLASRGYRALGVAHAKEDKKWVYDGLIPLFDPPRHDTEETVKSAISMGVKVKMITGDQAPIAKETCRQLGMGELIHLPKTLMDLENEHRSSGLSAKEIARGQDGLVWEADGFAEVFPEHKYRIVEILQLNNHTVGMTGDGVNDAPALKKADVGIAVADSTDAARAAADIVLLSPGLGVIITAITGSRKIFQRMRNYCIYALTSTIRVVLTFSLLAIIWDFEFPTLLIAIMAILNDGTILTISTDRVEPSPYPDKWDLSVIFTLSIALGCLMALSSLILFCLVHQESWFGHLHSIFGLPELNDNQVRALIYMHLSISGQAVIFITRAPSWFFLSAPSKLLCFAFVVAQCIATAIGIFGFGGYPSDAGVEGCGWQYAILAWCWSLIWFFPLDPLKRVVVAINQKVFARRDLQVDELSAKLRMARKEPGKKKEQNAHPVYGGIATRPSFSVGNAWPTLMVPVINPDDISEANSSIKRASFSYFDRPQDSTQNMRMSDSSLLI